MNNSRKHQFLGLDLGSISLNCIITNEKGEVLFSHYQRTSGQPIRKTLELLEAIDTSLGNIRITGAVVTGSGKELIAEPAGIATVNEIMAHATAAWQAYPNIASVFEIGGQDSKYITIGRRRSGEHFLKDHSFNQLCAAGTGAFLDQQAERIGLSIEKLGELAEKAPRAANVAGRCSVFAKSDMIHLQQRAVPVDEIAAGLCFALARNFLSTLCKGRIPQGPILFQGGVAANRGVVKAFREILNLQSEDLIIPQNFNVMGAYGSAIMAAGMPLAAPLTITALRQKLLPELQRGSSKS
jgi:predicted CoA-substrate-specific enzyme activase